jgi:hypothetical protein
MPIPYSRINAALIAALCTLLFALSSCSEPRAVARFVAPPTPHATTEPPPSAPAPHATTEPPPSASGGAIGQPFTLSLGATAQLAEADFSVTPREIIEDSRCPANAHCLWQGRVVIAGTLSSDGQVQPFTLGTLSGFADAPAELAVGAFTLRIVAVEPYPESFDTALAAADYQISLQLDVVP